MKVAAVLLFGLLLQDVKELEKELRSSDERDQRNLLVVCRAIWTRRSISGHAATMRLPSEANASERPSGEKRAWLSRAGV